MGAQSFLVPIQTVGSQTLWRGTGLVLKNLLRFFKTRGWRSTGSALAGACVQVLASKLTSLRYFVCKSGITVVTTSLLCHEIYGAEAAYSRPASHGQWWWLQHSRPYAWLPEGLLQQKVHNCESLRLIFTESSVAIAQSHPVPGLVYQKGQCTQGGISKGGHQGALSQWQGQEGGDDSRIWGQQSLPFPVARVLPMWSIAPHAMCLFLPGQSVLMSLHKLLLNKARCWLGE